MFDQRGIEPRHQARAGAAVAGSGGVTSRVINADCREAMREFARTHEVTPVPARQGVTGALLDAWTEFRGTRARPRIAILDWDDVPTRTEFELFQAHFRAMNLECVIDDPRNVVPMFRAVARSIRETRQG